MVVCAGNTCTRVHARVSEKSRWRTNAPPPSFCPLTPQRASDVCLPNEAVVLKGAGSVRPVPSVRFRPVRSGPTGGVQLLRKMSAAHEGAPLFSDSKGLISFYKLLFWIHIIQNSIIALFLGLSLFPLRHNYNLLLLFPSWKDPTIV